MDLRILPGQQSRRRTAQYRGELDTRGVRSGMTGIPAKALEADFEEWCQDAGWHAAKYAR